MTKIQLIEEETKKIVDNKYNGYTFIDIENSSEDVIQASVESLKKLDLESRYVVLLEYIDNRTNYNDMRIQKPFMDNFKEELTDIQRRTNRYS